jgi:hypothetical protein
MEAFLLTLVRNRPESPGMLRQSTGSASRILLLGVVQG